ncbi:hypothetical protein ACU4GD_27480 [Cupriavidus basilensis]
MTSGIESGKLGWRSGPPWPPPTSSGSTSKGARTHGARSPGRHRPHRGGLADRHGPADHPEPPGQRHAGAFGDYRRHPSMAATA